MAKTRILLIEDNLILRNGIKVILGEQQDMAVVSTIGSGAHVLLKARQSVPDVILVDVSLKNINELSLVRSVREHLPEAKVIGMGFVPSQADIIEFVEAGASGFILKDATIKEFVTTVRSVAEGKKILPPTMTDSLFSHVIDVALRKRRNTPVKAVRMTDREREIALLIADGLSNKQIGEKLVIATFTVKSHVHNILEKMALSSRLQIAIHSRTEHTH